MQELINLGIICLAGVIAYAIGAIFNYIDHCRYMSDLKKFYKSDLNRFAAKKILKQAKVYFLDKGYSTDEAEAEAIIYLKSVTENGLLQEKYRLLKEA